MKKSNTIVARKSGRKAAWQKGLVWLLLCALMAAGTAGCGNTKKPEAPKEEAEAETEVEAVTDESAEDAEKETEELQYAGEAETAEGGEEAEPGPREAEGYVSEEFEYMDENGNPLTEEDIASMDGDLSEGTKTGVDGMGTPFTEYKDLMSFIPNVKIGVETLEVLPFIPVEERYLLYNDGMYEIQYEDEDGKQVSFRKGELQEGMEDISGVYLEFENTTMERIADVDVALSGNKGECSLATWNAGGYAYSIFAEPGCSTDDMTAMINALRASAE